ncbi:MAG: DUF1232 domain-containing protein [Bacteroidia bacterium]|nr:DUF1232 domain-containing protein [Bacteroidia bacterium]
MTDNNQPKGFAKAKKQAESLLQNGKKLKDLLDKAVEKSKAQMKALSGFWEDLQRLIRFIRAYATGDYKDVAGTTVLYAVAAILYFVNPFDVIPDFILNLGFIDDATVIGFVLKNIKDELDKFVEWEKSS